MLKKKLGIEAVERDWYDYSIEDYFKINSTLIIPEGCLWIGYAAFQGCERLEKVEIPKSVRWIEGYTFSGCVDATIILKKPKKDFEEIGETSFDGVRYVKEEIRSGSDRERLA